MVFELVLSELLGTTGRPFSKTLRENDLMGWISNQQMSLCFFL